MREANGESSSSDDDEDDDGDDLGGGSRGTGSQMLGNDLANVFKD